MPPDRGWGTRGADANGGPHHTLERLGRCVRVAGDCWSWSPSNLRHETAHFAPAPAPAHEVPTRYDRWFTTSIFDTILHAIFYIGRYLTSLFVL